MSLPYKSDLIPQAKKLRKQATPQENHLWYDFLRSYPIRFQRQKAIEQYFQVNSFPSYFLIDQEGNLLPFKVDARNLDALEELIRRNDRQDKETNNSN